PFAGGRGARWGGPLHRVSRATADTNVLTSLLHFPCGQAALARNSRSQAEPISRSPSRGHRGSRRIARSSSEGAAGTDIWRVFNELPNLNAVASPERHSIQLQRKSCGRESSHEQLVAAQLLSGSDGERLRPGQSRRLPFSLSLR